MGFSFDWITLDFLSMFIVFHHICHYLCSQMTKQNEIINKKYIKKKKEANWSLLQCLALSPTLFNIYMAPSPLIH